MIACNRTKVKIKTHF